MAAGDTQITIVGNLVDDPAAPLHPDRERGGQLPRRLDAPVHGPGDERVEGRRLLFLTCNVWRQAAENVAESLQRGMRVIVSGRLRQRSYETKEGEKRTVYEIEVDEVGPSLRNASAKVTKSVPVRRWRWRRLRRRRRCGGGQGGSAVAAAAVRRRTPGCSDDPWAIRRRRRRRRRFSDEPPF